MIIYKFYADWCNPCKELTEELKEFSDKITEVNVDDIDDAGLFVKYNVKKMPFIIFTDVEGNVLKRLSGGSEGRITKEKFVKVWDSLINE